MNGRELLRGAKRVLRPILPAPVLAWREARYYGRYGEIELKVVDLLCRIGADAIDVGAHEGCYARVMRRYSHRVYAYEPLPWMARDLAKKFHYGVTVNAVALSRAPGNAVLKVPILEGKPIPGCSTISKARAPRFPEHEAIEVAVDTLDHHYSGEAGFIKIDVEGHELAVLEGARGTIARCRPRILVEIDERWRPGAVARADAFFRALDYRGCFVFEHDLLPMERFDGAAMLRAEERPDMTASLDQRPRFPRYVENFLFLPAEEDEELRRRLAARIAALG